MAQLGSLKSRLERLEAQSPPADGGGPWRLVPWYPDRDEPEPVPAEGERIIILRAVSPPKRPEGDA